MANKYKISKRENHGMGYHSHLMAFPKKGYIRAGYALTHDGSDIYITPHNRQLVRIDDHSINGILKKVGPSFRESYRSISSSDMQRVSNDSIRLGAF